LGIFSLIQLINDETCLDLPSGACWLQLSELKCETCTIRGDSDKKPCKQWQWINRCSFADACAIFSRQCGDCHLSPCTFQSMTKFAAKVSLSLQIFHAGAGEPLFFIIQCGWSF